MLASFLACLLGCLLDYGTSRLLPSFLLASFLAQLGAHMQPKDIIACFLFSLPLIREILVCGSLGVYGATFGAFEGPR